jgi:hypothetical protein
MDTHGYDCYFKNGKCEIWFNNACVGVALLHNELYLLSLRDKVHSACDANVNVIASLSKCEQEKKENSRCVIEIMALPFRPYFEGKN